MIRARRAAPITGLLFTLAALAGCERGGERGARERALSNESPDSSPAASAKLALGLRGKTTATTSVADLRKLGGERVTVTDPHEHAAIDLEGVRVTTLFDALLGPGWRQEEEVVATCTDGFHPSIPVHEFLSHDGYIAYARPGAPDFAVQEEPAKRTHVGPFYVVWKRGPSEDPPEPMWPYQVTALEVTDFATRFAPAIPPPEASPLAHEGFARFRTFCLPCHTVNGAGGAVGPELNYPVSVTEYFAEPILRQWIADPKEVRWNAKMPAPLPPGDDQAARAKTIDAIVGYLKAMAQAKVRP